MDDLLTFLGTPTGAVVTALGLGLATAKVADNKGLSIRKWFAGGLLFGIIALPMVLLMKPDREELDRRAVTRGSAKRCSACAELVRPDALVCRHCGHSFAPTSAAEAPTA